MTAMTLNDFSRVGRHAAPAPVSAGELVDAVLEGAPDGFPAEWRHQRVAPTDVRIKLAHYGGYEHFERDDSAAGYVFRWIGRTAMAE
jgi:hypothetical protein